MTSSCHIVIMEKHCPHCNRTLPVTSFHKDKKKKDGLRSWCRECCSWKFQHKFLGTEAYQRRLKRYEDNRKAQRLIDPRPQWITNAMSNAKRRAADAGVEFTLTREDIQRVLVDVCPLLGVRFTFANKKTTHSSPSLDRKDSTKGYTPDNVWVISAKANRIKSDATTDEIAMVAENLRNAGI